MFPPRQRTMLGFILHICIYTPTVDKLLTGWWFGTWLVFSHILGIIIPIDFHIFQKGWVNHQPAYNMMSPCDHLQIHNLGDRPTLVLSRVRWSCNMRRLLQTPGVGGPLGRGPESNTENDVEQLKSKIQLKYFIRCWYLNCFLFGIRLQHHAFGQFMGKPWLDGNAEAGSVGD